MFFTDFTLKGKLTDNKLKNFIRIYYGNIKSLDISKCDANEVTKSGLYRFYYTYMGSYSLTYLKLFPTTLENDLPYLKDFVKGEAEFKAIGINTPSDVLTKPALPSKIKP